MEDLFGRGEFGFFRGGSRELDVDSGDVSGCFLFGGG